MTGWDDIRKKCPKLYKHGIVFECARGWHDLVLDLSIKLERLIEKRLMKNGVPEDSDYMDLELYALQVKEKYGKLRFYMSYETKEVSDLIHEAESISSQTCESCGAPAKMRGVKWFSVRCDKCFGG